MSGPLELRAGAHLWCVVPCWVQLGKVVEWNFPDVFIHPLHLHVNPFQIVKLGQDQLAPGLNYTSWFEVSQGKQTQQCSIERRGKCGRLHTYFLA